MWGLPHSKFEGMKDNTGKAISIDPQYQVYSAFSYFHSFCGSNVGILEEAQRLNNIGDLIEIDTPPESPVNLGSMFLPSSKFFHGKTTLEFKGISVINGNQCAMLQMNEKDGGYLMFIKPMPVIRVKTLGGTRYSTTMFLDLKTGWISRVEATVIDVTKTTMYAIPVELATMITDISIKAVSKEDFEASIST